MQTLYYSTSNWIRHTDNIVDLEQYRRKLSQAEDHQPAEGPELIVLPQPSAPRTRRSQRLRRRALLLDAWASMGVLVMTLTFCPAGAGGLIRRRIRFSRTLPAALEQTGAPDGSASKSLRRSTGGRVRRPARSPPRDVSPAIP